MSIQEYVHPYSDLLLLRLRRLAWLFRQDLPVPGIQERVEVILTRNLLVLDVLLERLGHRWGQSRKEVDLEGLLDRPHIRQSALRTIPSGSLEERCGQTEGGGLAFSGGSLGHGPSYQLQEQKARLIGALCAPIWPREARHGTPSGLDPAPAMAKASGSEGMTRGGSRSGRRTLPGTAGARRASPRRACRQPRRGCTEPKLSGRSAGSAP